MTHDINETHDPKLQSWVESANDPRTDFPIQNLPIVLFGAPSDIPRVGVRIGDSVLSLWDLWDAGCFASLDEGALDASFMVHLNIFMSDGAPIWRAVRWAVSKLLSADEPTLRDDAALRERALLQVSDLTLLAPTTIGNYTDFYASVHHATNVGSMFRPDNALLPNYKWVPIGYHGRASSIVPSGTPIRRPMGQTKSDDAPGSAPGSTPTPPEFGPCKMLDYELEVGWFVGPGNNLGEPIPLEKAEDNIFGVCLVNDWSARDMQKWEYQPLGPFLAKNFATTISPYVVTMEALAPFRCAAYERPAGDPRPLPYLSSAANERAGGIDIQLEVLLTSAQMRERGAPPVRLSRGSFRHMYWTIAQMLTHHASNGCNLRPGDLMASGTVSGPEPESRGCMLELSWQGRDASGKPMPRKPIQLPTGETRTFLADGDEVIFKGFCEREGFRRIGLGECRGIIEPAKG